MLLETELLERTLDTDPLREWPDWDDCLEGVLDRLRSDFSSHSSNLGGQKGLESEETFFFLFFFSEHT